MHTIYTEGARNLIHPRYVTNVSDQDITVMYSSEQYTIQPGETILTDLNIANIFESYGIIREHDATTARVLSEVKTLVVSAADPSSVVKAARRQAVLPKVVVELPTFDDLRTELTMMNMGQLRARAKANGLVMLPTATKIALIEAIYNEEMGLAAEEVEAE